MREHPPTTCDPTHRQRLPAAGGAGDDLAVGIHGVQISHVLGRGVQDEALELSRRRQDQRERRGHPPHALSACPSQPWIPDVERPYHTHVRVSKGIFSIDSLCPVGIPVVMDNGCLTIIPRK